MVIVHEKDSRKQKGIPAIDNRELQSMNEYTNTEGFIRLGLPKTREIP